MALQNQQPNNSEFTISLTSFVADEYRLALIKVFREQKVSFTEVKVINDPLASIANVRDRSAYIGVIGYKYGPVPEDNSLNPEQLSLSELEFNEALDKNKSILILIRDGYDRTNIDSETDPAKKKKLEAFRSRAMKLNSDASASRLAVKFEGAHDFGQIASRKIAELRENHVERSIASSRETQATAPPARALVFISASHEDYAWRDRLKSALDTFAADIEWWDDSRIATGSKGLAEIDAAIARASVAVLVLSPSYIDSDVARSELDRLLKRASTGKLQLFPIMYKAVQWNRLPAGVKELQIWSIDKPVSDLRGAAGKKELEEIAAAVAKSVKDHQVSVQQTHPQKPAQAPVYSKSTREVLKRATALAIKGGRSGVNSSSLLFALAEPTAEDNTGRFVRDCFDRAGSFEEQLEKFMSQRGDANRQRATEAYGVEGKASKNAAAILENAGKFAVRVSYGPPEIFPRHIFTALLVTPEVETNQIARERFQDLGLNLESLRREFLEFIRPDVVQSEDLAGWAAILTAKTFQDGPPGYTSEFCGLGSRKKVTDDLGVGDWADQLAELIALRETKLPLAIGLFGNWGSGKSHFMNLIDQRLASLMEEEKGQGNGTRGRWCTEVVRVYFNAWHYLDANLWASLVSQIFESLFAHLRPKGNELQKVEDLLKEASGATARAAEQVKIAEEETKKAANELVVAQETLQNSQTVLRGLRDGLKNLLAESDRDKLERDAAEVLGVSNIKLKTVDELRKFVKEAESLSGRATSLWKRLTKEPGRARRLAFIAISVIVLYSIAAVTTPQFPWLQHKLSSLGPKLTSLLTVLGALMISLSPLLIAIAKGLKTMESWVSKAELAQAQAPETEAVKKADLNVAAAEGRETAARMRFAESMARESQLKEEVRNLDPDRRIGRYIEQRAQSLDYRGQLGLVSLARRDFEELSDMFTNREAKIKDLREKQKQLQEEEQRRKQKEEHELKPQPKQELEQEQTQEQTQAEKLGKKADDINLLERSVDRIVLFVDDLDRCQPEKIVEVLQAVHLLLAFPLFAVVVGVDQRALRRSLRTQMKGLVADETRSSNKTNDEVNLDKTIVDAERAASPLDYLEKIFHVPFHLPPMGDTGFKSLIDRLTEPVEVPDTSDTSHAQSMNNKTDNDLPDLSENSTETPTQDTQHEEHMKEEKERTIEETSGEEPGRVVPTAAPVATGVVGSVPLQRWERDALRAYHPLIQTPRAATRLLNTYRLVRASIPQTEWIAFAGDGMLDGEFRVAMLLLATAAGYPSVARDWFDRLRTKGTVELSLPDALEDKEAARILKSVYDDTFEHLTTPVTDELLEKWLHRVSRFAF